MKRQLLTMMIFLSAFYTMAQKSILNNNVQIFNGKDEKTVTGNVLIVNNLISKIATALIPTDKNTNLTIIDGKGNF
jgi:hypothetical protein